jgi:hypothetical protein
MPSEPIRAVAFAPANASIVYAGVGNALMKSVDGGVTFVASGVGLPGDQPLLDVEVDPTNSSVVYVLTDIYTGSNTGGVFKSADGGATFVLRNVGIEGVYGWAIAIDPSSPGTLYIAADANGVFRTTNGAASWHAVADGLTTPFARDVVVDPSIPGRVYVGSATSSVFAADFQPACPSGSDGAPCDDGDACTVNDVCTSGVCQGTPPACGDGVVGACEECDDGSANGTPASCCTAACRLATAGTPCADDGDLCTADRCTAAGVCAHPSEHDPLCVAPTHGGGVLKVVDRTGTGTDQVAFKWTKGPAITTPNFGAPNGTTAYALCVYDRTATGDVLAYRGRPLPPCARTPCWSAVANGWRFRSSAGPDGVRSIMLKSGASGRSKLVVKAKGAPLALTPTPFAKSPSVVAEVRSSDGACWGATFSTALKNVTGSFSARSD